jgi:phosphatidylinositol glycan class Q protein
MPEYNGLMRIFWPSDAPRTECPGIIVGWRNSAMDLFVVSILGDVDVSCFVARMTWMLLLTLTN